MNRVNGQNNSAAGFSGCGFTLNSRHSNKNISLLSCFKDNYHFIFYSNLNLLFFETAILKLLARKENTPVIFKSASVLKVLQDVKGILTEPELVSTQAN